MARIGISSAFCRQFGKRLRRLREAHKPAMSLTGLAVRAGMSVPYVSQLESGKRTPSLAALFALASALGCEVWELMMVKSDDPSARLLLALHDGDTAAVRVALEAFGLRLRGE